MVVREMQIKTTVRCHHMLTLLIKSGLAKTRVIGIPAAAAAAASESVKLY